MLNIMSRILCSYMIDLHTHTTFSDGELIPSELVRRAEVLGAEMLTEEDGR